MEQTADDSTALRALLHRWLVQYNPLYLLSAALCLFGMFVCSRSLAHEASGLLAVAGIAEVYGVALVLGAALLTRLGQRRPAVLLALICAVYQGDLTLHTEACALLGDAGKIAALVWLVLFAAKLRGLAWALRLHISRSAWAVLLGGALGMTLIPHLFQQLSPRGSSGIVGIWLAALLTAGVYAERGITSIVPLDSWGQTVLRRALRAAWLLWSTLVALHIAFWNLHVPLSGAVLLLVPLLVLTRYVQTEAQVWTAVTFALCATALLAPADLTIIAFAAAVTLAARAQWHRRIHLAPDQVKSSIPYRHGEDVIRVPGFQALIPETPQTRKRLFTGALFATYLSLWTFDWHAAPWPSHILALDIGLTLLVLAGAWKARVRISLVPLGTVYLHFLVQTRIVAAPATALAWGALSVSAGFVLLLVSLLASYLLRDASRASSTADAKSRSAP